MSSVTIEIDSRELEHKLDLVLNPEWGEAVIEGITGYAEGQVKEHTPKITGNLRRSEQKEIEGLEGRVFQVESIAEYARFIETGECEVGPYERKAPRTGTKHTVRKHKRVLRTQEGGYRMFEKGYDDAVAKAETIIGNVAREMEAEWGK